MRINNQIKTSLFFLVFTLLLSSKSTFSQENTSTRDLYLYGFIDNTNGSDTTRLQLCTDLFHSQFDASQDFLLHDKRLIQFSPEILDLHKNTNDLLFYHAVSKNENSWSSTLNLLDFATGKEINLTKEYKDFYKILMDAKDALSELFQKQTAKPIEQISIQENEKPSSNYTIADVYGTWKGEENIHKIVILGAGRGFIIFENGASMNVSVKVENQKLLIEQECLTTPDFYPDIPIDFAAELTEKATPITWEFYIESTTQLNGSKNTYAFIDSNNSIEPTILQVRWYR